VSQKVTNDQVKVGEQANKKTLCHTGKYQKMRTMVQWTILVGGIGEGGCKTGAMMIPNYFQLAVISVVGACLGAIPRTVCSPQPVGARSKLSNPSSDIRIRFPTAEKVTPETKIEKNHNSKCRGNIHWDEGKNMRKNMCKYAKNMCENMHKMVRLASPYLINHAIFFTGCDEILDQKEVLIILITPKEQFFFLEKNWSYEGSKKFERSKKHHPKPVL
jgi:hypothetical protein